MRRILALPYSELLLARCYSDKAGSYLNLIRWVSPRTIKETFVPPTDHRYPFLG